MMKERTLNKEGYKKEGHTWEAHVEKAAVQIVLGSKMPRVAGRIQETRFLKKTAGKISFG